MANRIYEDYMNMASVVMKGYGNIMKSCYDVYLLPMLGEVPEVPKISTYMKPSIQNAESKKVPDVKAVVQTSMIQEIPIAVRLPEKTALHK